MKEVYGLKIEQVLKELNSNLKGLTEKEVQQNRQKYGRNITVEVKKTSPFMILLRQFKSLIVYVLLTAAFLSYLIGEYTEVYVIGAIVLFIILLSFFEEYKASREMDALRELTPPKAKVKREGQIKEILAEEIVPGDILILRRGDLVAADARIIKASSLKTDESALTGESQAVIKKEAVLKRKTPLAERYNMLFAGSQVMNGDAECIAVSTGKTTEIGKISQMIKSVKQEETPLQKRLDKFGKKASIIVIILCAFIVVFGLLRGQDLEHILLLAVAVSVSGIPESLPAVIGVVLAMGMKQMASRKAIIKRLPAVETLGTCTVICSDKTGTLTQNKMVIEKIYAFDTEINVTGKGLTPKGLFLEEDEEIDPKKRKGISKILEIGVLCNNSELKKKGKDWKIEGESTEGALVVLAKKAGIDKTSYHKNYPRVKEHPFDPERKCMTSVHMVKNKPIVYTKGAPEVLLKKSEYYLQNGKVKKLTNKERQQILDKTQEYAQQGMRVLGLAYKEHKGKTYELKRVEQGLIFSGLVSIRDPPAENVMQSVESCKQAGIKVVMITGDNKDTALSIAKELGIYEEHSHAITGPELDAMDDKEFMKIVRNVAVYARTTPKHKLRIVQALQKSGGIVAMTGDGVNDAPALKQADIGVAMGKRGTEVAKEAAEMVIEDDNFATIVNAVQQGRTIYTNIQKFIYYLLAGNFSEVILMLIAILIGVLPPLTPLMILFINLVTSDIPALGLAVEKPSPKIMHQKPRNPKEGILSDYLFLKLGQVVPLIVLGTIGLFMYELAFGGATLEKARTIAFATVIFFELFHALNAKSLDESILSRRMFSNWQLLLGVFLSAAATVLAVYWAPMQGIFSTVALGYKEWVTVVLVSASALFFVEIQKTIVSSEIKEMEKLEISEKS